MVSEFISMEKKHFTIDLGKKIFTIYFHEKYMVFEFTHKTTRELLLTKFKVFREKLTTGGGISLRVPCTFRFFSLNSILPDSGDIASLDKYRLE